MTSIIILLIVLAIYTTVLIILYDDNTSRKESIKTAIGTFVGVILSIQTSVYLEGVKETDEYIKHLENVVVKSPAKFLIPYDVVGLNYYSTDLDPVTGFDNETSVQKFSRSLFIHHGIHSGDDYTADGRKNMRKLLEELREKTRGYTPSQQDYARSNNMMRETITYVEMLNKLLQSDQFIKSGSRDLRRNIMHVLINIDKMKNNMVYYIRPDGRYVLYEYIKRTEDLVTLEILSKEKTHLFKDTFKRAMGSVSAGQEGTGRFYSECKDDVQRRKGGL